MLLEEVLESLVAREGGDYLDGTLGEGGAAEAILLRAGAAASVLGLDRDPEVLSRARARLARYGERMRIACGPFEDAFEAARSHGFEVFRGILLDLGLSSFQLEVERRGFSFAEESSPLDLRLDPSGAASAGDLLRSEDEREIERILRAGGEERYARPLARAITRERGRLRTAGDLRRLVESVVRGRRGRIHPATLAFQAIRYAVNDELGTLERGLVAVFPLLEGGGRLAVISFESLTDRIVKRFMQGKARSGEGVLRTRKPIVAGPEEVRANPRSRSAKLRVLQRVG